MVAALSVIAHFWFSRSVEAQGPALGTNELIPAGSYIIPMDNTLQNIGSPFNLRSYGLVERLLWAGIPVKWAIAPGKLKDGVDFVATAQRVYPTATVASSLNFSGGPFIIHSDFAVSALTVIAAYAPGNNIAVYQTTQDVIVPVRHTLTHRPKVAVFDDGGNASIHTTFLAAAGFIAGTHYDVIPAATLVTVNADACFTIGTEPHWGATGSASDPQVNAVRQFVGSGGNLLAQCEGVTSYENNSTYGRFQTTLGITDGRGNTPFQYPSPDLPYSQFIGNVADAGGSVRDYAPLAGSAYRATTELHAQKSSGSINGSDGSLPVKASVGKLPAAPTEGGYVFYLGGHDYTTGDITNINGIRMYLNAVMTPTSRPSSCNLAITPRTIAGTVYEDANGDSNLSDGVGRMGVNVRLYQDANNNGVVDAGDTFLVETTTGAGGGYSFQVSLEATGSNYLVAVDSKTVTPVAGLIPGRGDVWAEQTYGDDSSTAPFDLGSRFGGRQPGTSDNFNTASTAPANNSYQHLARVNVGAGVVANADFGFSFNVVTNMRGGDTADDDTSSTGRSVQGGFRQFIQNANAINGANYMRFVPAVAANNGSGWRFTVTSILAALVDADTTIDGRAYSSANGTTVIDSNPGSLGAGGSAGVDDLSIPQVARPELEIAGGNAIGVGLDFQANNLAVRRISIFGFGSIADSDAHANIRVGSGFVNAMIEENVIGAVATSFSDPGAGVRTGGDNVRSTGGMSGTVRNNMIGFAAGAGFSLSSGSTGWLIESNEIRGNGIGNSNLAGISIQNGSGSSTVRGNLIVGNEGAGVDLYQGSGTSVLENNTITGNGIGPNANVVTPGARLYGASNLVDRNVINANFGAGVMVTSASSGNTITRNSIYANGTITNKAGGGPSNQIGIDLLAASDNQSTGTAPFVTVNDSGDADTGGNGLLNFPVLSTAQILVGNLTLKGYARPGSAIEFFIAAADPTGFGEGQTYLLTLTEGSAQDQDATSGTYTSPVNGLNVGTDNTNLFQFTIPVPFGVGIGTILTATATVAGDTSEFSGNVVVAASPPDVNLTKACPSPANCTAEPQQPGTDLTYTIEFVNVGGMAAQDFLITDQVPANTDFKLNSITSDLMTTGLTVNVLYSNDGGATYTYTPVDGAGGAPAGYDGTVTNIRWSFVGSLSNNSPNNIGNVSFIVRIR